MFSPLDTAPAPRSSTWRVALKRSADKALAFITLEGYDTDDVRERFAAAAVAERAPAGTPDLLTALRGDDLPSATSRPRVRPTDPHIATLPAGRPTVGTPGQRRPRRTTASARRPAAAPAPAVCTAPVAASGTRA